MKNNQKVLLLLAVIIVIVLIYKWNDWFGVKNGTNGTSTNGTGTGLRSFRTGGGFGASVGDGGGAVSGGFTGGQTGGAVTGPAAGPAVTTNPIVWPVNYTTTNSCADLLARKTTFERLKNTGSGFTSAGIYDINTAGWIGNMDSKRWIGNMDSKRYFETKLDYMRWIQGTLDVLNTQLNQLGCTNNAAGATRYRTS